MNNLGTSKFQGFKILKILLFLGLILNLISCDFSSQLQKEILMAQEDIGQQKYSMAITRYENVLKLHPPKKVLVKIYFQLGDLYSIHQGDPQKAVTYFRKLKEITDDPTWLVKAEEKLADIHFLYLKEYKEAASSYSNLVKFSPVLEKFDLYQFRLGLSYLEQNEKEKGQEVFLKIATHPQHKYYNQAYYYLGLIYFQNKDWHKAISTWELYLKKEQRKDRIIQTKFLMANAYETLEALQDAYELYYSILGEYPNAEVITGRLKSLYSRRIARKR